MNIPVVGAIVLAAGQSRRMGSPKMTLAWGDTTVIGRVTSVLSEAGIQPVIVVCGAAEDEIRTALGNSSVRIVKNTAYLRGDMLQSLQCGLQVLPGDVEAVLVVLGDQPQIEPQIVGRVRGHFLEKGSGLVVPSYQMRRGHPWLMSEKYWAEVLGMGEEESLRDFLNRHSQEIYYVESDNNSILKDLDTPETYAVEKPR